MLGVGGWVLLRGGGSGGPWGTGVVIRGNKGFGRFKVGRGIAG